MVKAGSEDQTAPGSESAGAAASQDSVLFTHDCKNTCRIGLPPVATEDLYHERAIKLGKLEPIHHITFNPKGQMFVTRGKELYKGPTPSTPWENWFEQAKCVGRSVWDSFHILCFSPAGDLYALTREGILYKGPEPDNEHVPWLYSRAKKIDNLSQHSIGGLFFDPDGTLYGIVGEQLRRSPPLYNVDKDWLQNSIVVGASGWDRLSNVRFSYDGNLWCISHSGDLLTAPPPTDPNEDWKSTARTVGTGYLSYGYMSMIRDTTIKRVLHIEFLTDTGKVLSIEPMLVQEQTYNNKDSTTPMKELFEVNRVLVSESTFGQEHGFEFSAKAETTFETGIPLAMKGMVHLSAKATNSHTWNFTETNRVETRFKRTSEVEVPPGKAVLWKAVAKKATMDIPYEATVLTVFGNEETIYGTWKGASIFDKKVKQVDL
ncbi:uncharacterized protein [Ambystoma mexicanum]|uniref:uncharacterized protein isoform X2 n=1 Tax=Ambystoma mexicanum TaxID=8296 RepID=UPI0037E91104